MGNDVGHPDWEGIRAEYVAGGVSQRALAERRGVSYGALRRRAAAEGWAGAREERLGGGRTPRRASARDAGEAGNAEIAARLRKKLLMRLERVADAIPDGALTETKGQDESTVTLFKLRDLTAAYKDLAGDMQRDEAADIEDLEPLAELLRE